MAAGEFDTAVSRGDGTAVTVGVAPGADESAEDVADDTVGGDPADGGPLRPLPVLDADRGPGRRGMTAAEEYASSILLGGDDVDLVVHEVAHMWFYGMVGNSQFRDPWLDEAFASFAE